MIGIDIIDRKAILSRSSNKIQRYRNRVLAPEEQFLLQDYSASNLDIWIAWAIKESVYKLEYRSQSLRYLNAKKLQILKLYTQKNSNKLRILVKGLLSLYYVRVDISTEYIWAKAFLDEKIAPKTHHALVFSKLHEIKEISEKANHLLVKKVMEVYGLGKEPLLIKRPFLEIIINEKQKIAASISHHGAWIAFSFGPLVNQTYSSSKGSFVPNSRA